MMLRMLKGKIHRATVTDAHLDYEGSLSVDPTLMERAGLRVGEVVLVANVANGSRFETYLIEGGAGEICLNGAAAHLGKVGDKVIIMAFAWLDADEAESFRPSVVLVDDDNRPT